MYQVIDRSTQTRLQLMPQKGRKELRVVGVVIHSMAEIFADDSFGSWVAGIMTMLDFVQKLQRLFTLT